MRNDIPVNQLRALLRYEPETGFLYWKERPASLFADTAERSGSRNASWWNGRFSGKRACKPDAHKGYLRVGIFKVEYPAHRVIWAMESGAWPAETIDHIDGDKANNRLENLREASVSENNRNRANFGKSQYRGVSWRSRQSTWIAAIKTDGKVTFLGSFGTEEDAARAYDQAAIVQHGQFARTNFPQADCERRVLSCLSVEPAGVVSHKPAPGDTQDDLPLTDEAQEPVAWQHRGPRGGWITTDEETDYSERALYASPPKAVTITDEMVERAADVFAKSLGFAGAFIEHTQAAHKALTAALSSEAHNG